MELKKIKCVAEKEYELRLIGEFGYDIIAAYIIPELVWMKQNNPVNILRVRLNTEGGSVMEAVKIFSEILRLNIPFTVHNDGICASMGGFFWLATIKENRYMANFAQCMWHNPMSDGISLEQVLDPEEKKACEAFKDQIMKLIVHNSGKTAEEMDAIMAETTWANVEKCIEMGFLLKENVESYQQAPVLKTADVEAKQLVKIAASFMSDKYKAEATKNQTNNNQIEIDMEKELRNKVTAVLELNDAANDESILKAITASQAKHKAIVDDITAKLETEKKEKKELAEKLAKVEASLADFQKKEAQEKEAKIVARVEADLKAKKFKVEAKESMLALAKANFAEYEKLSDSIMPQVVAPDVTAHLVDDGATAAKAYGVPEKDFNFDTMSRKYSAVLTKIKTEKPELYKALEAQYIAANPEV